MAENVELSTALATAEAAASTADIQGHSSYAASTEAEAESHMRKEAAVAAGTVVEYVRRGLLSPDAGVVQMMTTRVLIVC